jgi:fucose permease
MLILSIILLPIAIWQTAKLTDTKPTADDEDPTQPKTPIPPIWRAPKLQWILSIGMTCGILIDVVGADWLTIYTHEHLGVPTGPDAIPITLFMLAVIIGRLNTDRVAQAIGMDNLVRISGYVGFLGGIIAIAGSHFMREVGVWQALLVVTWIGNSPAAVTLSRMSMVNHVFIWNGKLLIAGIAGAFGMQVALLIPALLMLITVALAKYVRPPKGVKV